MKKFILKTFSCISFIILSINLISASPLDALSNKKSETLIVRDSASITGLPDRFRDIPTLNISGSAQFTSEQVTNLRDGINKPNICIVDLRQESHGLVNDYAISFFNPTKDLVNIHDNKTQFEFLEDFYNYVSKNKSNNYTTTYSEWIKEA